MQNSKLNARIVFQLYLPELITEEKYKRHLKFSRGTIQCLDGDKVIAMHDFASKLSQGHHTFFGDF
jgi:hypothetical protein